MYDRQEIIDILQYLMGEKYLHVDTSRYLYCSKRDIFFPFDEQEETQVYWFTGDKRWFQM